MVAESTWDAPYDLGSPVTVVCRELNSVFLPPKADRATSSLALEDVLPLLRGQVVHALKVSSPSLLLWSQRTDRPPLGSSKTHSDQRSDTERSLYADKDRFRGAHTESATLWLTTNHQGDTHDAFFRRPMPCDS